MANTLTESAWRRGWNDTKIQINHWTFYIINLSASIVLFIIGYFAFQWYWGVILGITILIAPFGLIWLYSTFSATLKQRNEARNQITLFRQETGGENTTSRIQSKLKGKFFHTFDKEGYVRQQGQIIDLVNDDTVLIQLYDWILGQSSNKKIVSLKNMAKSGWALYDSNEDMLYAFKYGLVKKRPG